MSQGYFEKRENVKDKREESKKKKAAQATFLFGGEQGIRTLEQVIARYTISNRAPSASSDNSPNKLPAYYNLLK